MTLKIKVVLPAKIGVFGNSQELQFGTNKPREKNRLVQQRRKPYFMEKLGVVALKSKPTGEKQEVRVITVSHGLSG